MATTVAPDVTADLNEPRPGSVATVKPKLIFHCQQAHGSPMGFISNFSSVRELYQRISECYGLSLDDILFCTLNTHKIDMNYLLGGQLGLEDFIFVHLRGQPKEIEIVKSEEHLGLTITDNGAGKAFIKRIKEDSITGKHRTFICIGDHIEKVNDISCVGKRHYEVAKLLREIPVGRTILLRLIEPIKSGFSQISSSRSGKKGGKIGSGRETLRLRATGPAIVEVPDTSEELAINKINSLLESFIGISDNDLSKSIWEAGSSRTNPHEFICAINDSDLSTFDFSDDFIFDLWGAISDAKCGRLSSSLDEATKHNDEFDEVLKNQQQNHIHNSKNSSSLSSNRHSSGKHSRIKGINPAAILSGMQH